MALGRFGDPRGHRLRLVARPRRRRRAGCLLHLVPWGRDGLSLDLMRRTPDCDNGVVELMVADWSRRRLLGISRVSLNFAVFRACSSGARA